MEHIINIITGLITELLAFVLGMVFVYIIVRIPFLRSFSKKLGIKIHFDKPQLDFDIRTNEKNNSFNLAIKNAGNRPAYNVYIYLFESYPSDSNKNNSYSIKSLGDQNVRSGVLSVGETVVFKNIKIQFEGCNVTCIQEIWVDYSDEDNDHFRTIVQTGSARGDDLIVHPPEQLRKRLLMIPGYEYSGIANIDKLRAGKDI